MGQCMNPGMMPRLPLPPSVPVGGSPALPPWSTVPASGSRGRVVFEPVPLFPFAGVVTAVVPPWVPSGFLSPPPVQATEQSSTADRARAERPHAEACRMRCMTFIV